MFLAGTGTPEQEKRTISKALSAAERSNLICSGGESAANSVRNREDPGIRYTGISAARA
jgi:hypothetical protein